MKTMNDIELKSDDLTYAFLLYVQSLDSELSRMIAMILTISALAHLAHRYVLVPGTLLLALTAVYQVTRDRIRRGKAKYPEWSFAVELVVGMIRAWTLGFDTATFKDDEIRRRFRAQMDIGARLQAKIATWRFGMSMIDLKANGVQCHWLGKGLKEDKQAPLGVSNVTQDDTIIVYLHGGGYVAFSPHSHADLAARLIISTEEEFVKIGKPTSVRALMVDYRLAPEYVFPSSIEDVSNVYKWLLSNHIKPGNVIIAGDSAGGGLCLSSLLAFKAQQLPMPNSSVCISPLVDISCSMSPGSTDCFVSRRLAELCRDLYVGTADCSEISSLHADLSTLPPLFVSVGQLEIFIPEIVELEKRCKQFGVLCDLRIYPNMPHIFQFLRDLLPAAQTGIDDIAKFICRNSPLAQLNIAESIAAVLLEMKKLNATNEQVISSALMLSRRGATPKRQRLTPRRSAAQNSLVRIAHAPEPLGAQPLSSAAIA